MEKTKLSYRYGEYILDVIYFHGEDTASLMMIGFGNISWPLLWAKNVSKRQAQAYTSIFEATGFHDMPIDC